MNDFPKHEAGGSRDAFLAYLHDYLLETGCVQAAQALAQETNFSFQGPVPDSFFYDWWCLLWAAYSASRPPEAAQGPERAARAPLHPGQMQPTFKVPMRGPQAAAAPRKPAAAQRAPPQTQKAPQKAPQKKPQPDISQLPIIVPGNAPLLVRHTSTDALAPGGIPGHAFAPPSAMLPQHAPFDPSYDAYRAKAAPQMAQQPPPHAQQLRQPPQLLQGRPAPVAYAGYQPAYAPQQMPGGMAAMDPMYGNQGMRPVHLTKMSQAAYQRAVRAGAGQPGKMAVSDKDALGITLDGGANYAGVAAAPVDAFEPGPDALFGMRGDMLEPSMGALDGKAAPDPAAPPHAGMRHGDPALDMMGGAMGFANGFKEEPAFAGDFDGNMNLTFDGDGAGDMFFEAPLMTF